MDKTTASSSDAKDTKLWSRRRRKQTRTGTLIIWPSAQEVRVNLNADNFHRATQPQKTSTSRDSPSKSSLSRRQTVSNIDEHKLESDPRLHSKSPPASLRGTPLGSRNPSAQYTKRYPPRHLCSISHPAKKLGDDKKPQPQRVPPAPQKRIKIAVQQDQGRFNLPCFRQCFIWLFLIPLWVFFTIMLMLVVKGKEKESFFRNTDIIQDKFKAYPLGGSSDSITVKFEVMGPFETALSQVNRNYTFDDFPNRILIFWLERWYVNKDVKDPVKPTDALYKETYAAEGQLWHLLMRYAPKESYDLNKGTYRVLNLYIPPTNLTKGSEEDREKIKGKRRVYILVIQKYKYNISYPTVPMAVRFSLHDVDIASCVIAAILMLVLLHLLFVLEILVNRTLAAVVAATTYLGVLVAMLEQRPTFLDVIKWMKVDVLLLVFSVMLIVNIAADTGIYDVIALGLYQITRGHAGWLFLFICASTFLVCLILNNIVTVMFMTPIVIRSFEIFNLDPVPILIAVTMFSNIAGAATFPGSYPTSLIGRDEWVHKHEVTSLKMFSSLILSLCLIAIQTGFFFWLFFYFYKVHIIRTSLIVHDLNQQSKLWRRSCEGIPDVAEHSYVIKEKLDDYAEDVEEKRDRYMNKKGKRNRLVNLFNALKNKIKKKKDSVKEKKKEDIEKKEVTPTKSESKEAPVIKEETDVPTKNAKEKPLQIYSPAGTPIATPQMSSHEERSRDKIPPIKNTEGVGDENVKDVKGQKDEKDDKGKKEANDKPMVEKKDKKSFKEKIYKVLGIDMQKSTEPEVRFADKIIELKGENMITNWCLLLKVAAAVIVAFFLLILPFKTITIEWGVLLAALLLLLMMDKTELERLLHKIEWSTLILLAALFVFSAAQEMIGFTDYIKTLVEDRVQDKNEESRLSFAVFVYTWVIIPFLFCYKDDNGNIYLKEVIGLAAALCNNIAIADSALQAVLASAASIDMNLQLQPLLWAYVMGVCLGGNITLIGAGPNIVCAGLAEQQGYRITYLRFLKYGLCVGIVNLFFANIILRIRY